MPALDPKRLSFTDKGTFIMNKNDKITQKESRAANQSQTDAQQDTNRQLIIHAQYVKDFSFENPNAPKVLIENVDQPDVEINVRVSAKLINENQYEVLLHLGAKAVTGETTMFLVDLTYAGLVSPQGVTGNDVNPLIMIEAPRLLFPFARALISDATRDGGFMPLNIQPVDFVAVYKHNIEQQTLAKKNS